MQDVSKKFNKIYLELESEHFFQSSKKHRECFHPEAPADQQALSLPQGVCGAAVVHKWDLCGGGTLSACEDASWRVGEDFSEPSDQTCDISVPATLKTEEHCRKNGKRGRSSASWSMYKWQNELEYGNRCYFY